MQNITFILFCFPVFIYLNIDNLIYLKCYYIAIIQIYICVINKL